MTSPAGGISIARLVQHCQLPDEHVLDVQVTSDHFHEVSRPSFKKLSSQLDKRLQSSAGYLEIKMVLNPEVATLPTL